MKHTKGERLDIDCLSEIIGRWVQKAMEGSSQKS